ncbi:MAG: hypothetical protein IT562_17440 [Alphaproteobacteria bacterium]|nr:hypothetical protein [Alphaproteobacteria bacterium]
MDVVEAVIDVAIALERVELKSPDLEELVDVREGLADVEDVLGGAEVRHDVISADVRGHRQVQVDRVVGARVAKIDRAVAAGAEYRIEVPLRVRPRPVAVEDRRHDPLAVRGREMPGSDALHRLAIAPDILRAEIENRGVGRNARSQGKRAQPLDVQRSNGHNASVDDQSRREPGRSGHMYVMTGA